ncbi:unnamed protein product, partial [Mesorhabditis spiculigera]
MDAVELKTYLETILVGMAELRTEQCQIRSDISKLRCELKDLWLQVAKDISNRDSKEAAIEISGTNKESCA